MDKKKVKNISGVSIQVIGVGEVEAGDIIDVAFDFHNANFEEVGQAQKASEQTETKKETKKISKSI